MRLTLTIEKRDNRTEDPVLERRAIQKSRIGIGELSSARFLLAFRYSRHYNHITLRKVKTSIWNHPPLLKNTLSAYSF